MRRQLLNPNTRRNASTTTCAETRSAHFSHLASSLEFRPAEFFGTHDNDEDDRAEDASANAKDAICGIIKHI